jgi:hypothetical protein
MPKDTSFLCLGSALCGCVSAIKIALTLFLFMFMIGTQAVKAQQSDTRNEFWPEIDFDLAGAYRVAGPLDAVLGARYLGTGVSAEGDGGALSEDRDSNVWNAFVGARIRTMMAEKWGILVHGDLGFGGSDQNFMTQAAVQFRPVPRFGIDVGYKWLHNEVTDPARPVGIDMDLRGAVLGVSFVF